MTARGQWLLAGCGLLLLAACSDSGGSPIVDAAVPPDGYLASDAQNIPDSGPQQLVAEIAVANCPDWRLQDETTSCVGRSPLTLTFVAVTSMEADTFRWNVGDGSDPLDGEVVQHTYNVPGTYDVSVVVGGTFGSVQASKPALVIAGPSPTGGYCLAHDNCGSGHCLCGQESWSPECPPQMSGTCTQFCENEPCTDGTCVDLRPGLQPSTPGETPPWRRPLCLKPCQSEWDCARAGFACVELPGFDALAGTDGWTAVCLPELLSPIGGSCVDGAGLPDPGACAGGACEPLGGLGFCTQVCTQGSCPSYTLCAQVTGGQQQICMPVCSPEYSCDHDPMLACEVEDASGHLGFALIDVPVSPTDTYCAPKRCAENHECGPDGNCDLNLGGFCQPNN